MFLARDDGIREILSERSEGPHEQRGSGKERNSDQHGSQR
jgi:hypothetical protein